MADFLSSCKEVRAPVIAVRFQRRDVESGEVYLRVMDKRGKGGNTVFLKMNRPLSLFGQGFLMCSTVLRRNISNQFTITAIFKIGGRTK